MAKDSKESESIKKQRFFVWLPLGLIAVYRYLISPLLGPRCRFYPSCSQYSEEAYKRFGLLKGTKLTIQRLLKCHPLHPGGVDLVPEKNSQQR